MDAIELLETDHQRVSGLFEQIQQSDNLDDKRALFRTIKHEIETHAQIEENIFYPFFAKREDFQEIVDDSFADHQEVREILSELEDVLADTHTAEDDSSQVDDLIDELVACVDDHVEEEEGEFFPRVREVLDEDELEHLGQELESAKGDYPQAA